MAVYNAEEYLQEAVNSILSQTYKTFECIIINDGSTDKTKEILDTFTDERLIIIHLQENQGAANALNIGISHANGKWIAIHDGDDCSMPSRLEEQLLFVKENPSLVGVGSLISCIPAGANVDRGQLEAEAYGANRFKTPEEIYHNRFYGCSLVHGSMLISKEVFDKVGAYNPRYKIGYDYDLWLRMLECGEMAKIESILYQWRINPNSLSRKNYIKTCDEVHLASISAIERMLFQNLGRKPVFDIICTRNAGIHFYNDIAPQLNISINRYVRVESGLNKICEDVIQGDSDGIIILDSMSKKSYRAIDFFEKNGLVYNKNLFFIWNVVN